MKTLHTTIAFAFLITLFSQAGLAGNKHKLNSINKEIKSVSSSLSSDRSKRSKLQHELKKLETDAAKLNLKINKTRKALGKQNNNYATLNHEKTVLLKRQEKEKKLLAKQVRSTYLFGDKNALKLLLNQDDPSKTSRLLTYLKHLNAYRLEEINKINDSLIALQKNQEALEKSKKDLAELHTQLKKELSKQATNKEKRIKLLSRVTKDIRTEQQQLSNLIANKHELENVIKALNLKQRLARQNLKKLKGKLSWPTKGRVIVKFGQHINKSPLRWEAVLLSAKDGAPVKAVASGKIAFASWMPDLGLLIIIDHGNGYMTLYGRNGNLYKNVGDKVAAGDIIATVGHSGGHNKPALYFAIRHNGQPLNPSKWCRKTS